MLFLNNHKTKTNDAISKNKKETQNIKIELLYSVIASSIFLFFLPRNVNYKSPFLIN